MPDRAVYVCVGSVDDPHSSLWRMWTQGEDFYAKQIGIPTPWKLSIHASGRCRLAVLEGDAGLGIEWDEESDPRVMKRWRVDPVGTAVYCPCFILMAPSVFVGPRRTFRDLPGKDRIDRVIWVDPAAVGWRTEVVCIRDTDTLLDPSQSFGEQQVLGHLDLGTSSRIWIIRSVTKLSDKEFADWQRQVGKAVFRRTTPRGVLPVLVDPRKPVDAAFVTLISPVTHDYPAIAELNLGHHNTPDPEAV